MQTTAATERARRRSSGFVQPSVKKIKHVTIKVATVIPEIGFDDEPISPVRREETVTNRKPKTTTRSAPATALSQATSVPKKIAKRTIKPKLPNNTTDIDISFSVRLTSATSPPAGIEDNPDRI